MTHKLITLSIDIGGSGIKGRTFQGPEDPTSERVRVRTPRPAKPEAVIKEIEKLCTTLAPFDRVSIGFPGVVHDGIIHTAPNLDGKWQEIDLQQRLAKDLNKPVRVINDADMHGYGAIQGKGLEMMVVLGTGVGACLFINGHLVPNLELGHHPFEKSMTYEQRLGQAALDEIGDKEWKKRLERAIKLWRATYNFRILYLGGGNARHIEGKLAPDIEIKPNAIAFAGGVKLWG